MRLRSSGEVRCSPSFSWSGLASEVYRLRKRIGLSGLIVGFSRMAMSTVDFDMMITSG